MNVRGAVECSVQVTVRLHRHFDEIIIIYGVLLLLSGRRVTLIYRFIWHRCGDRPNCMRDKIYILIVCVVFNWLVAFVRMPSIQFQHQHPIAALS